MCMRLFCSERLRAAAAGALARAAPPRRPFLTRARAQRARAASDRGAGRARARGGAVFFTSLLLGGGAALPFLLALRASAACGQQKKVEREDSMRPRRA